MYDYLIVGSGLYGSVFAYEAKKAGKTCLVIEKRDHIAGNIYCENIAGIHVHKYGAHIFHTNNETVWNYVCNFAEFNDYKHSVLAVNGDKLYHLPFNLTTMYETLSTYNPEEIKRIIREEHSIWGSNYCLQHGDSPNPSLESFIIREVGTTIYNVLIKHYTEKQWGKKCDELPPSIINRIPIRFNFDNHYFSDKYQGIPINGFTDMVNKMLDGIPVLLNTDFNDNRNYWLSQAKHIIYCGAPDELMDYSLGKLEWRSLEFHITDTEKCQGTSVINYTDDRKYTRVIDHKWFNYKNDNHTVLTYEYPTKWEIGKERYYPINDDNNDLLYKKYVNAISAAYPSISLGGRLGLYKYIDIDDCIELAMQHIEYITKKDELL